MQKFLILPWVLDLLQFLFLLSVPIFSSFVKIYLSISRGYFVGSIKNFRLKSTLHRLLVFFHFLSLLNIFSSLLFNLIQIVKVIPMFLFFFLRNLLLGLNTESLLRIEHRLRRLLTWFCFILFFLNQWFEPLFVIFKIIFYLFFITVPHIIKLFI